MLIRRSVSVLLLLLLLTQLATCERPLSGKSTVAKVMVTMVQLEQVKARILRGLNMTAAPHKSPPTTRMLTPDSSKVKGKMPQERNEKQPDIAMIFSESAADEKTGTVAFKLDSRVRDHLDHIEVALLVVRLRYCPDVWDRDSLNESDATGRLDNTTNHGTEQSCRKHKRGSEIKQNEMRSKSNRHATNATADSLENEPNNSRGRSSNSRGQASKLRPDRKSRKTRGLKTWRVKVVVKVVDTESSRSRRMAVERVSVRGTSTMAVPVSRAVLAKAALSANHSLLIQMTCKRCQGRVHIENVYNSRGRPSKKRKRAPRLNPNRPYLFIKTSSPTSGGSRSDKQSSTDESPSSRLRRSNFSSWPPHNSSVLDAGPVQCSCSSQTDEISFQKAGLDFIIYPKAFKVEHCVRPCWTSPANHSTASAAQLSHMEGPRLAERPRCGSDSTVGLARRTSARAWSTVKASVHWRRDPREAASTARSRRCVSIVINPRPLPVVYLNGSNMAATGTFERVVDETCDC